MKLIIKGLPPYTIVKYHRTSKGIRQTHNDGHSSYYYCRSKRPFDYFNKCLLGFLSNLPKTKHYDFKNGKEVKV